MKETDYVKLIMDTRHVMNLHAAAGGRLQCEKMSISAMRCIYAYIDLQAADLKAQKNPSAVTHNEYKKLQETFDKHCKNHHNLISMYLNKAVLQ